MPKPADADDESPSEQGKTSLPQESDAVESNSPPRPPHVYQSEDLFRGRREIWIEHGNALYRLRITNADKLILTK